LGLYDAILIKDNHIAAAGGVKEALAKFVNQVVEIEAKTLTEVKEAITGKADRILLDNMSLATMRQAVKLCKKAGVETEASGGVNLSNVKAIAKTGVDYISVGALTHSAPALDISLEIV
jgi:nicotinate-nucleotide pyrophosphorylase (carboxylating)